MFALVWGWSIFGPFHFDDHSMLRDPRVTDSGGWWQVWLPLQTRPLTQFSFWLNYFLSGANALPFHAVNLLLHALNTWLVWRVLSRLTTASGEAAAAAAATIGAMVFALHPLQSEPVNYVFARSTLLMTAFCLFTVWFWIEDRYWPALGCFVLALLAKEECVTLPLALLLIDRMRGRRPRYWMAGGMLVAAGLAGVRAVVATRATPGAGAGFGAGITPVAYFEAQGVVIWRYLRLLIVPFGFTVDTEVAQPEVWVAALGWAAIAGLCVVAYCGRWWWVLMLFVLLIPSSTIFPAEDLAADRRMYLPLFAVGGLVAGFAWLRGRVVAVAVLLSLGAVSAYRTAFVWSSERALWQEAVERSPGKVRARIQLARTLDAAEAEAVLAEAAKMAPQDADVPNELGLILLRNGRAPEALAAFGRALALQPGSPMMLNNRGVALMELGQAKAAQADFVRALERDPCLADARRNLALVAKEALPSEYPRGCPTSPRSEPGE